MKDFLKILAVVVVSVIAGAYANRCSTEILRGPNALHLNGTAPRGCVIDTITYVDTIRYYQQDSKAEVRIGEMRTKVLALPQKADTTKGPNAMPLNGTAPRGLERDTLAADSVEVIIPIIQREYEGEDYRAWVSGYEPRLDSLYVFARHETVTIKEPPDRKHWHVGPAIGLGYTPQGIQPYLGISITYSIISF